MRAATLRGREMFIPLTHAPARRRPTLASPGDRRGEEHKAHYLAIDLPHSDDCFVGVSGGDDGGLSGGPRSGLAYFSGVPTTILYDNTKLAVARILGDGTGRRRGRSPSYKVTICSPRSSDGRRRVTTR